MSPLPYPILSITGSDGTGGSGIQADIKTCSALATYALSVVTAVTVQDTQGIKSTHAMAPEVIEAQIQSILRDMPPCAAKVGMLCEAEAVRAVARGLRECPHIVLDMAFISSRGERIAADDVVRAVCRHIMPMADVVVMNPYEASFLLDTTITTKEELLSAAERLVQRFQLEAVVIQSTHRLHDVQHDLFFAPGLAPEFFALPDRTDCNTHGMAGTLSIAIAAHLAKGADLPEAVRRAYSYLQTLTVYAVASPLGHQSALLSHQLSRQQELYNSFMQLVANHSHREHEVTFYAQLLNITPRYLSQITMAVGHSSPKQLIADTLIADATLLLTTTTQTIQEISIALGFSSQAQLTRLFRRRKGITPSECRYRL